MTVLLIGGGAPHHWIGLAAERSGVAGEIPGDTFWASDTNVTYVWTGAAWVVGTPLASPRLLYTPDEISVDVEIALDGTAGHGAVGNATLWTPVGQLELTSMFVYLDGVDSVGNAGTVSIGTAGDATLIAGASAGLDGSSGFMAAPGGALVPDGALDMIAAGFTGPAGWSTAAIVAHFAVAAANAGSLHAFAKYKRLSDDGALVGA